MVAIATKYMGLELCSPLIAAASPLSRELATVRQLEDEGAGAVVMFSLFQEQCVPGATRFGSAPWHALAAENYPLDSSEFPKTPPAYVEHVALAAQSVDIPIIASFNVGRPDRWVQQAPLLEQAGAAGIELDVYTIPSDPTLSATDVEDIYIEALEAVVELVDIPVALKLCPYFSALPAFARRADEAGAAALTIFNKLYQPTVDPDSRALRMHADLTRSSDSRLAIQWLALLHGQLKCSLAANGGFHVLADVLGGIFAGADVVALCSALLRHGVGHLGMLRTELVEWLEKNEVANIDDVRGTLSLAQYSNPSDFKRVGYAKVLNRYW